MANIHKEGSVAIDEFTSGTSAKRPRLDYSRVTKNITDIFAADPTDLTDPGTSSTETPKRILIEGAPGIGKTVLAKEIAYQWATNEILTEIKIVFLLYLRDPHLQSINKIEQLVQYMSNECLNSEQITNITLHLVNTEGHQLCIVLDGFDEYPTSLQKSSFIIDIINGVVLPEAIVVITSRPTATVSLHDRVDRRIDILGLPKEERDKYISQTFSNSPKRKVELDRYLKQQPIINGLCFVPLHLAILLYLFQQGSLPETLTEMNESFILHTIYRHLERYEQTPSGTVDKLSKLPQPFLDNVYGLSVLAFNGLQENKLVFTFDEIKKACPHFDETVGAINGFGLLQAVEHYPHKGAGRTTSLNFLHYTMQEFLAALHVSNLPSEQQSSLMENTFWDGHYNFLWMMFVGIVGIKSDIFVNFVSKGKVYKRKSEIRIDDKIRKDKRKLLHVFQCYLEAKENTEIPEVISSLFKDSEVIFNKVKLLPHNVTSLMSFICTKESIHWKTLQLQQCEIGDIGMSVLQQFISENTSTLEYVDLSDNKSSPWGVYCAIIRYCSVNSLTLCGNHGIQDYVNEIKEGLQMNTRLISLTLCNITNNGAITIAEAIRLNTTLQKLNISNNSISDDGAAAISDNLKFSTSLQEINISQNSITNRGIKLFAEAIQINSTLKNINISKNHISIEGLLYFMEKVKKNCTLEVVNITHNNVTRSGLTSIKQCIENLQRPIQIYASWNVIVSRNGELLKICTFHESENIIEEDDVWSFEDYDPDYIVTCLSECLKEDDTLQELNMSKHQIIIGREKKIIEAIKVNKTLLKLDASFTKIRDEDYISDCLKINKSLKELNMSENMITSNGAKEIATAIRVNTTLEKLDLSCNRISNDGVSFISDGLKNNNSLQELNISRNEITSEGAQYIAEAIQVNTTLEKINVSCNAISDDGAAAIIYSLQFNNSLQELNMSRNEITSEGAKKITEVIQVNTTLKHLDLSINKIADDGANFIGDGLQFNTSLQELNISHNCITNKITSKGAKMIGEAIKVNKILKKLYIHGNSISDDGAAAISDGLKYNISLQELDMSWNKITSKGANMIAVAIKVNKILKKLDIHGNSISDDGAAAISDGLKYNISLLELKMSYNEITSKGANMIAEAIKVNKTLQKLNINNNSISDDGAAAISDGLKCNISLQELDMSWNKITSKGANMIAEAIKVNKTLQKLNIAHNSISDDGAAAISDGLKCNISLQELNMSYNKITNEGANMIGEAIKVNKILKKLDIHGNSISDDGAAAISDGLKYNISLQELDMSWIKITNKGAKTIAEAIQVNTTLHTLHLYQFNIRGKPSFNMTVLTAVNHNNTLMKLSLPWVYGDDKRLVSSEVKKINKERTRQGISTLTCH